MSQPPKQESEGEKMKQPSAPPKNAQNWGQDGYKKSSEMSSLRTPLEVYRVDSNFTPFKIPIDHVFNAIYDQP